MIMGILNITPDSFSDGGAWLEPDRAVERALAMLDEGADLLDLGAESTRPGGGVYGHGAQEVPATEEIDRLLPVLERLRKHTDAPLSVDTRKGAVAEAALAAGADIVNDVSALADDDLAAAAARAGVPVILMHSRGDLASMQRGIRFDAVVRDVHDELAMAIERAAEAGIDCDQLVVDPGIGFGKNVEQNLALLRELRALSDLAPVLVGASRKSFIGAVHEAPVEQRLPGSLAAVGWAARAGAGFVRVHDVAETAQYLDVWCAIRDAGGPS